MKKILGNFKDDLVEQLKNTETNIMEKMKKQIMTTKQAIKKDIVQVKSDVEKQKEDIEKIKECLDKIENRENGEKAEDIFASMAKKAPLIMEPVKLEASASLWFEYSNTILLD